MPGMNGTGPMGMGPGTGWGRGLCYGKSPYRGAGSWMGWASRRGRGLRRGFMAGGRAGRWWGDPVPLGSYSKKDEIAWLENRMKTLKEEIEAAERRMNELFADSGN
jgi:hypothetical protein